MNPYSIRRPYPPLSSRDDTDDMPHTYPTDMVGLRRDPVYMNGTPMRRQLMELGQLPERLYRKLLAHYRRNSEFYIMTDGSIAQERCQDGTAANAAAALDSLK